jgi:hypothetical protein
MGKAIPDRRKISLKAGENIRYVVPHSIGTDREVTLRMRAREPEQKVRLRVGDILSKSLPVVKPREMLSIRLSKKHLDRIEEEATELVVSCEKRESRL